MASLSREVRSGLEVMSIALAEGMSVVAKRVKGVRKYWMVVNSFIFLYSIALLLLGF